MVARERLEFLDPGVTEIDLFIEFNLAWSFAYKLDSQRVVFRREQAREGEHLAASHYRIVDDVRVAIDLESVPLCERWLLPKLRIFLKINDIVENHFHTGLPIKRKMVRPVSLSITDKNGEAHECVAEAFDTTYNVPILLSPEKALTSKTIALSPRSRAGY